jgi:hypothetical protein
VWLEKNRVAAAKCRIKEKQQVDQMVQDSRLMAKENTELRNLVTTVEIDGNASLGALG